MFRQILARLRGVVWPAVVSAALLVLSLGIAVFAPASAPVALVFALAGVGFAVLAQRA